MKNLMIIISTLITVILISSCREIDIKTIVNIDGSLTRIITITGDSSDVYKKGLPYPINESWEMNFCKDTLSKDNFILTYTKSFANSAELNNEIKQDSGWRHQLKRNISIDNSFGFFYSYLTYNETIKAANPFKFLDYRDYLNESDMIWLTGEKIAVNSADSAKIKEAEDKAEDYLQKSFSAEILALLKDGVKDLDNPRIKTDLVDYYADSISNKVRDWDLDSIYGFVDYFAAITQKKEIEKIKETKKAQLEGIDKKNELLAKIFGMEEYSVTVEMPGLLTNTNSPSIKGNKVHWKVSTMSFLFKDFQMVSESRIVNLYMFIIAGILLLSLIILAAIKLWK